MKLTRFLLISSLMLVFAGAAFAEDNDAGFGYGQKDSRMHGKKGKGRNAIHEKIGLSDEQKAKVEKLNKDHFKTVRNLRKDIRSATDDLRTELEKVTSDKSVIKKISDKIKKFKTKEFDLRTEHVLSLKGILSSEQFKKLNELQKKKGKRMRHRKGNRPKKGKKGDM